MNKLFLQLLTIIIPFLFILFFTVSPVKAMVYSSSYESSPPPASYYQCPDLSGCYAFYDCWNSQSAGVTDCGRACNGGSPWAHYVYSACLQSPSDPFTCINWFTITANACSTADKYNSGNPPVLNAGFCNCNVGGGYKTCCNGYSLVNATPTNIDPYAPPEGYCSNASVVYCGGGGQPACGQDACGYPPACVPGACDAAEPACGQTTYGSNGCSSCSKTGVDCPTGVCVPGSWKTTCTTSKC